MSVSIVLQRLLKSYINLHSYLSFRRESQKFTKEKALNTLNFVKSSSPVETDLFGCLSSAHVLCCQEEWRDSVKRSLGEMHGHPLLSRIEANFSVTSLDRRTTTDAIESALQVGLQQVTRFFRDDKVQAVRADTMLKLAEYVMYAIDDIAVTAVEVLNRGNSLDALTLKEVIRAAHEARSYIFGFFSGRISQHHTSFHNPSRFVSMLSLFLHRPVFQPNNKRCNTRRDQHLCSFSINGSTRWEPWNVLCEHLGLDPLQRENQRILGLLDKDLSLCQSLVLEKSLKRILGDSADNHIEDCRICGRCFTIIPFDSSNVFDTLWSTHPCSDVHRDRNNILFLRDKRATQQLERMYQQLDEDQRETVKVAVDSRRIPLLIVGRGGTGKTAVTLVIRWIMILRANYRKVAASSMMKLNANQINGLTLHKVSGLGRITKAKVPMVNEEDVVKWLEGLERYVSSDALSDDIRLSILRMEVLIIDEVFSCDHDFFRAVDQIFRCVRGRRDTFFGGVQVILVGDCLQTGTVGYTDCDWKDNYGFAYIKIRDPRDSRRVNDYRINPHGGTRYFCESDCFLAANFYVSLLQTPHRFNKIKNESQWDQDVLKHCAEGTVSADDLAYLSTVVGRNVPLKYVVEAARANYKLFQTNDLENDQPTRTYRYRCQNPTFKTRMEFITKVATAQDPYALLRKDPYYARLPDGETDEPHVYMCNENKQVSAYVSDCSDTGVDSWTIEAEEYVEEDAGQTRRGLVKNGARTTTPDTHQWHNVLESECLFPSKITLYKGLVVKFLSNRIGDYVARNQLGTVQSYDRTNGTVTVIPDSSDTSRHCVEHIVSISEEIIEHFDTRLGKNVRLIRRQFPLALGRGSTVHSVKGATLQCISLWDNVRGIELPGVGYTAVSRGCDPQNHLIVCKPIAKDFAPNPTGHALNEYLMKKVGETKTTIFPVDFVFDYNHARKCIGVSKSKQAQRREDATNLRRGENIAYFGRR